MFGTRRTDYKLKIPKLRGLILRFFGTLGIKNRLNRCDQYHLYFLRFAYNGYERKLCKANLYIIEITDNT